ncbi:HET-domain-containing protein [Xylaria arbuscula]|nr:HET-domain-containing protein [Xylaria arbuscula]
MAATYPMYQPLDPALKSIRVLDLLPGVFENDLRGVLRTGRTLKIRPDGKWISKSIELPITDNLFRALRRLRRPLKTHVLWVDAVCINQEDIGERSAQVALMEEIYSNAGFTAIWLGDISGRTIYDDDLTGRQTLMQSVSSLLPSNPVSDIFWNGDCIPMDHAIQTTTPSWKDRGWIIQEYVLSQKPYFQFGSRTRAIDKAGTSLGHRGFAVPDSGFILEKRIDAFPGLWGLAERLKKLDQIRAAMERGKQMSLYHAALATAESETTDPRDKRKLVYPDYHSSAEVVFSRATYAALKGPTNFAILELIKFDTSGCSSPLPTWSYDFRTSDPTELKFEGVCCDVVADLTLKLPGFREECSDHANHNINTEACIVAETCQKALELIDVAKRFFRGNDSTGTSNDCDDPSERQNYLSSLIFGTSSHRAHAHETVVSNLFKNWDSLITYLGISQSHHTSQLSVREFSDLSQSRFYCEEASGSTTVFITTSGVIGIAPGIIEGGDRLVLPLCETSAGDIDAKVTPFKKPLALILRERGDDKWTFHGLAHLRGLGDKAHYMQHSKSYTIR